jgi:hypothetical protein
VRAVAQRNDRLHDFLERFEHVSIEHIADPLAAEHGAGGPDPVSLSDTADKVAALAAQAGANESVAYRLGGAHARIEAALSTPGTYGGTVDVFRNMIAQHALGLGRPNYSLPK